VRRSYRSRRAKVESRTRAAIPPSAVRDLIEAAQGLRDRALLTLAYEHGLRASEVGVLRVAAYDQAQRLIDIYRCKSRRIYHGVPVLARSAAALDAWLDGREVVGAAASWIFPGHSRPCSTCRGWLTVTEDWIDRLPKKCPSCLAPRAEWGKRVSFGISRYAVWEIVKGAAERAGIVKSWPHVLRHSCVTHFLDAGVHPADVQQRAGHASLNTTWGYWASTRRAREDLQRAADAAWDER
jgi:integrase/recombinase XerD